jgi:hypothetical protein
VVRPPNKRGAVPKDGPHDGAGQGSSPAQLTSPRKRRREIAAMPLTRVEVEQARLRGYIDERGERELLERGALW